MPLPSAGTHIIGDDDSDVTFTPWAKFEATNDAIAVATGRAAGMQSTGFQSTDMLEQGGYSGTLSIKAGSEGTVRMMVNAHFFMDDISKWRFDEHFACNWQLTTDLTGKVKLTPAAPEWNFADAEHARFQISSVVPNQDNDAGIFQLTAAFTGPQDSKSGGWNLGGNVDTKKGLQGGGSYGKGTGRTFPAPMLTRTFSVQVKVTDIPPAPKHEHGHAAVGSISASTRQSFDVRFATGKADLKGQTKLATDEERRLRQWYMQLSPETRQGMHEGTIVPTLNGYTSTTDTAPHNRILAHGRVEAVKAVLRDWGVGKFDDTSPGEYPYIEEDPKQEVEDPADRRVLIEVDAAPVQIAPAEPDFVDAKP